MTVIPVLDVMNGVVVRGVGGRRDEYRPVRSSLTSNNAPSAMIDAIADHFGFDEFYLADLDGLRIGRPDVDGLRQTLSKPLRFIVDAGIVDIDAASELVGLGDVRIVAASESTPSSAVLKTMMERFGGERVVFSMDLKSGVPIVAAQEWKNLGPEDVVDAASQTGATRFILLDLADVGEGRGMGTLALLRRLRRRFPEAWIAVGGGVRSQADLDAAEDAGADAVLIASVLHDGRYPFR